MIKTRNRKHSKKLLSLLMLLTLLFTMLPTAAFAEATEEEKLAAQQKRDELQQQLREIEERLSAIKDDVERAEEKANSYADRKWIVTQQIDAIQESITLKEEELKLRQQELDEKKAAQQENYELFKQRLRAIYMTNDTSALSTLLGASSFSEFLVRAEVMRQVSEHDTQLIEQLKKEQEEIEAAQKVIEEELASLEEDKEALAVKQSELAALLQEANSELSTAEALEEVTQEEYDKINAAFKQADAELDAIMGTGSDTIYGTGEYGWPVPGFTYISSGFGWRTLYGQPNFHGGIDIAGSGIYGTPVVASDSGTVVRALYYTTGYGYHVMIDHGGNNWTVYGHLSSIAVSYGQYVSKGEMVGRVGSTGNSTGPHLHFEIRLNGTKVNPLLYL